MSAAYYIVSEEPVEGFDLFVNGKALAHASDLLDRLAEGAGVRPLMDFFSMDPAEVDAIFDDLLANQAEGGDANGDDAPEGDSDPDVVAFGGAGLVAPEDPDLDVDHPLAESLESIAAQETPPEEWYPAAEGLATVHALIAAVAAQPAPAEPDPFEPTPDAILADLREFVAVLDHLHAARIRWHLSVDF